MFSTDTRDWCPYCGTLYLSTRKLARHMKDAHNRLILTKDINEQLERQRTKARLAEMECELA